MKKITILLFAMISLLSFKNQASAQISVSANINIASQPAWAPVGYDYARYYYFPDIDVYYSIPRQQFVYQSGNSWLFASSLPSRFHYDVYSGYKVVINDPKPYLKPGFYRNKYGSFKGTHQKQVIIRDSREEKYYVVKGHPMHEQYVRTHPAKKYQH